MKKSLESFETHNFRYSYNDITNVFESQFDRDLHLMVIWSNARVKESEIIEEVNKNFKILSCSEVFWSNENIDNNFHRIYDITPTDSVAGKRSEVGDNPFIVLMVEDLSPAYQYRFDASGKFKIVSSKIVDYKNLFREWVGGSYMIHSTDNLKEFLNNSILFFGYERAFKLINNQEWDRKIDKYAHDLVGANGWESLEQFFTTLNLTTEYVVLRGVENIEKTVQSSTGDIDILCSNIGEFTASANARNIWNSKNFFHVYIAGKKVLLDIRSTGDDYFDKEWQKNIIKNRVLSSYNIYVPRIDDYFFSHLYHAYIHKPYFYDKYIVRLDKLARNIGVNTFKEDCQKNRENIIKLLRGFLLANNYTVTIPKDEQVYLNVKFISKLQRINKQRLYIRLYSVYIKNIFRKVIKKLKSIAKRNSLILKMYKKYIQK